MILGNQPLRVSFTTQPFFGLLCVPVRDDTWHPLAGACDGEIRVWDLSRRTCVWRAVGHRGFVRGLAVTPDGDTFLSAGEDGMVKQWDLTVASDLGQVGRLLGCYY